MTGPQYRGSVPAGMARCTRCTRLRPLADFPPAKRKRNGRSSWCRDCATAATHAWRATNRDSINAARRVSYPAKECVGCGLTFTPHRIDSRHCCPACRDACRANGTPLLPTTAADHIATYHPKEYRP